MNNIALCERIRTILAGRENIPEQKMFGGTCFMSNGNMCTGTWKDSPIVRLDRSRHEATLAEPHTRPADMDRRIMRGWVLAGPAGIESGNALAAWLERAVRFAESLPARQDRRRSRAWNGSGWTNNDCGERRVNDSEGVGEPSRLSVGQFVPMQEQILHRRVRT